MLIYVHLLNGLDECQFSLSLKLHHWNDSMMTLELLFLRGKLPPTTPPPASAVVACLSLANSERGHFYYRSWCSLGPASSSSVTKLAGGDQGQAACRLGCWPGSTSRELKKRVRLNSQNFNSQNKMDDLRFLCSIFLVFWKWQSYHFFVSMHFFTGPSV